MTNARTSQTCYRHFHRDKNTKSFSKIVPTVGDEKIVKFDIFGIEDSNWNIHVVIVPPQVAVENFQVAGLPCTPQSGNLRTTSELARQHHCDIAAMNGSPFGPDGACIGRAISDGICTCKSCSNEFIVSLGLTVDGNWMIGHNLTLANSRTAFR